MADTTDPGQEVAELRERLAAETDLRKRLVHVATALNSTLHTDELLGLVMRSAADLLDAETSSLLLLDEETGELEITLATGDPAADVEKQRIPKGQGIAGWTLEHRRPAVVSDPAADERFYSDIGQAIGFQTHNLLAVPLLVKDRAIGIVEVINKRGGADYDDTDVEIAQALANLAAIAIDNASMYARLADAVVSARMSYRL